MKNEDKFKELTKPIDIHQLSWRIGSKIKEEDKRTIKSTMVLCYIDVKVITERLDHVFGPQGWKTEKLENIEHGYTGGLSIKVDGEWVTKWDGTGYNEESTVKSAVTDVIKRCAVQWGIGRELREFPKFFINGDHHFLTQEHQDWIDSIISKDKAHWPNRVTFDDNRELTVEEAQKMTWPMGRNKGKLLTDIIKNDPGSIEWLNTKTAHDKFITLKAAARLLMKPQGKMMDEVLRDQIIESINRSPRAGDMKRRVKEVYGENVLHEILNLKLTYAAADEILQNILKKDFLGG